LAGSARDPIDAAMETSISAAARKRRGVLSAGIMLALVLLAGGLVFAFVRGMVPGVFNLLPALDLAQPDAWLIDWRLAALKHSPERCRRVLAPPHITAQPIPDNPVKDGCGWTNSVRVSAAGGMRASFDKLTCEAAAALALWLEHEVQPAAREILRRHVVSVRSLGGYSCRNIVGNGQWDKIRSQHAIANAIDVAAFYLADGRQISVGKHWSGEGPESRFLRVVHKRACRYFHAALGPGYNAAHYDHFHLDRGIFRHCQ